MSSYNIIGSNKAFRTGNEKLFVATFLLSIFYIGLFSYFMVWWVTVLGDALGIPTEVIITNLRQILLIRSLVQVMGLTILAIGTSVPDLLESVIVAKQGKGKHLEVS